MFYMLLNFKLVKTCFNILHCPVVFILQESTINESEKLNQMILPQLKFHIIGHQHI